MEKRTGRRASIGYFRSSVRSRMRGPDITLTEAESTVFGRGVTVLANYPSPQMLFSAFPLRCRLYTPTMKAVLEEQT